MRLHTLVLVAMLTTTVKAQDDQSKITIEITKEIDGEKRTFKGEYDSVEQMKSDPNYQEFAGDDDTFSFSFDGDSDDFAILDRLHDADHQGFKFYQGDMFSNMIRQHDSIFEKYGIHLYGMDMSEHDEQMKKPGIEWKSLREHLNDEKNTIKMVELKKVKVAEVDGNEFGKKGKVRESNKLILENLDFFPNPSSNGQFKVRFKLPAEGELNLKVSNPDGKEIFNRYFERFAGTYSESIDLSGQNEGIYLLEISRRKNRLTRKIIID